MSPREGDSAFFQNQVLTSVQLGTGLPTYLIHFSVVPDSRRPNSIRPVIYVARPLEEWAARNTDRWWLYDDDHASEVRHPRWVPQGGIRNGSVVVPTLDPDTRFSSLLDDEDTDDRRQERREHEADLLDGDDLDAPYRNLLDNLDGEPVEDPDDTPDSEPPRTELNQREPEMKVTMTINLDDGDIAEKEGIPAWEEHGTFHILANENGTAIVVEPAIGAGGLIRGVVRYKDKTSTLFNEPNVTSARAVAEKCLANKPYKNAYDHLLEGSPFDEPDPVEPEAIASKPVSAPEAPRPPPTKRVWKNVPITAGDED